MSKAERKRKTIKRGIEQDQQAIVTQDHRPPTKDEVAQRAYELFVSRGRTDGRDVEDWLGGTTTAREITSIVRETLGPTKFHKCRAP